MSQDSWQGCEAGFSETVMSDRGSVDERNDATTLGERDVGSTVEERPFKGRGEIEVNCGASAPVRHSAPAPIQTL